jgi:hypothetical protein
LGGGGGAGKRLARLAGLMAAEFQARSPSTTGVRTCRGRRGAWRLSCTDLHWKPHLAGLMVAVLLVQSPSGTVLSRGRRGRRSHLRGADMHVLMCTGWLPHLAA